MASVLAALRWFLDSLVPMLCCFAVQFSWFLAASRTFLEEFPVLTQTELASKSEWYPVYRWQVKQSFFSKATHNGLFNGQHGSHRWICFRPCSLTHQGAYIGVLSAHWLISKEIWYLKEISKQSPSKYHSHPFTHEATTQNLKLPKNQWWSGHFNYDIP